ncbi:hypothetical protein [Secundilactobacillus odoratitofui]|nr:hypothetical protein [Secundilactobacillus odoratitofui]
MKEQLLATPQTHFDYDHTRPLTTKDILILDPAERSYVQAHAYGVDLKSNQFV